MLWDAVGVAGPLDAAEAPQPQPCAAGGVAAGVFRTASWSAGREGIGGRSSRKVWVGTSSVSELPLPTVVIVNVAGNAVIFSPGW